MSKEIWMICDDEDLKYSKEEHAIYLKNGTKILFKNPKSPMGFCKFESSAAMCSIVDMPLSENEYAAALEHSDKFVDFYEGHLSKRGVTKKRV